MAELTAGEQVADDAQERDAWPIVALAASASAFAFVALLFALAGIINEDEGWYLLAGTHV